MAGPHRPALAAITGSHRAIRRYGGRLSAAMTSDRSAAAAWDAEYQAGRYAGEPPVRFTQDILTAAHAAGITAGLYFGCGNGRNYLPLTAAGLDLTGLDISAAAIAQLTARTPQRRNQLIPGDLTICRPARATRWSSVSRSSSTWVPHRRTRAHPCRARTGRPGRPVLPAGQRHRHRHLARARGDRTRPGRRADRPLPRRARDGLSIHFFSAEELAALFTCSFTPVLPPRLQHTWRDPPQRGQWSQWEAIWRKTS